MPEAFRQPDWRTKPSDRFILKWIKCRLSAPITPLLVHLGWLRPWMITLFAASLGILAGFLFALGMGFTAGLTAALSQILDGMDGQFARLTGSSSRAGAFLDSVIDRYADGAALDFARDRSSGCHRQQPDQLYQCTGGKPRDRPWPSHPGQQRDTNLAYRPLGTRHATLAGSAGSSPALPGCAPQHGGRETSAQVSPPEQAARIGAERSGTSRKGS